MSELTSTERLRELLDERGIKWFPMNGNGYQGDIDTEFVANGVKYTAHGWGFGLLVDMLTPEQAIAATLGSGTLTAEQVGETIERNIEKLCVLDDGKPVEWRDGWVCRVGIDYKAIADELNARLGGGECEMTVMDTGNEATYEHEYIMHCENCHHEFGYVQYNEDGDTWMDEKPRFCPNCRRMVFE